MMKGILVVSLLFISVGAMAEESFEGVGIVLSQKDGIIHVVNTLNSSPAQNAGIKSDELITAVDGVSITNGDLGNIVSLIRGPAGTQVSLTIADSANIHERNVLMTRVKFVLDCFMEGIYQLTTNGAGAVRATMISGIIGDQPVMWNITGNSIFGSYKGETINLDYMENAGSAMIMGFIHGQRIQWNGLGPNTFSGDQVCIQ
jgi:hypothetical protein